MTGTESCNCFESKLKPLLPRLFEEPCNHIEYLEGLNNYHVSFFTLRIPALPKTIICYQIQNLYGEGPVRGGPYQIRSTQVSPTTQLLHPTSRPHTVYAVFSAGANKTLDSKTMIRSTNNSLCTDQHMTITQCSRVLSSSVEHRFGCHPCQRRDASLVSHHGTGWAAHPLLTYRVTAGLLQVPGQAPENPLRLQRDDPRSKCHDMHTKTFLMGAESAADYFATICVSIW